MLSDRRATPSGLRARAAAADGRRDGAAARSVHGPDGRALCTAESCALVTDLTL